MLFDFLLLQRSIINLSKSTIRSLQRSWNDQIYRRSRLYSNFVFSWRTQLNSSSGQFCFVLWALHAIDGRSSAVACPFCAELVSYRQGEWQMTAVMNGMSGSPVEMTVMGEKAEKKAADRTWKGQSADIFSRRTSITDTATVYGNSQTRIIIASVSRNKIHKRRN